MQFVFHHRRRIVEDRPLDNRGILHLFERKCQGTRSDVGQGCTNVGEAQRTVIHRSDDAHRPLAQADIDKVKAVKQLHDSGAVRAELLAAFGEYEFRPHRVAVAGIGLHEASIYEMVQRSFQGWTVGVQAVQECDELRAATGLVEFGNDGHCPAVVKQ